MKKIDKEIDKICSILMEGTPEKEELDSISKFVYGIKDGLVHYIDGEVITKEELDQRILRKIEILTYFLERAKKFTLLDDENLKLYDE